MIMTTMLTVTVLRMTIPMIMMTLAVTKLMGMMKLTTMIMTMIELKKMMMMSHDDDNDDDDDDYAHM